MRYIEEVRNKDRGIGGLKIWLMYVREFGAESAMGRDCFCEIFDRYGFKLRRRRRTPRTTDSTYGNPTYPNLRKELITTRLGELIVSDITYIPLIDAITGERTFCYASLVPDSLARYCLNTAWVRPWRPSTRRRPCTWPSRCCCNMEWTCRTPSITATVGRNTLQPTISRRCTICVSPGGVD